MFQQTMLPKAESLIKRIKTVSYFIIFLISFPFEIIPNAKKEIAMSHIVREHLIGWLE